MNLTEFGFTEEHLRSKYLEDANGCWIFQGALGGAGDYGQFSWVVSGERHTRGAHILMYLIFVGPIPDGYEVDHLCRVHACGRPSHLEAVTHQVNQKRGLNGSKTHCKHGHPFDEENTYINTRGQRECRTCRTQAVYRSKAKRKGGDV